MINSLTFIEPPEGLSALEIKKQKRLFSATSTGSGIVFPNYANFKTQLTKPEDQGDYGTCVAHSTTTFVESLLWKLTGEKIEFTDDEIYNLYLDSYQYNHWNSSGKWDSTITTLSFKEIPSSVRYTMRQSDGSWVIPTEYDHGLLHYIGNYWIHMDQTWCMIYMFYWMCHYNDPDVAKNHYPCQHSLICDKFKNYLYNRMITLGGDAFGSSYSVHPDTFKQTFSFFGLPSVCGLRGLGRNSTSDPWSEIGHEVVTYKYSPTSVVYDSSWSEKQIFDIIFGYQSDSAPYYNKTSYSNPWAILSNMSQIDLYTKTAYGQSGNENKYQVTIADPFTGHGEILGVENKDCFCESSEIILYAKPDEGYYFQEWDIEENGKDYESWIFTSNPLKIKLSSDLRVDAFFTEYEPDAEMYILYKIDIISSDNCTMKSNGSESKTGVFPTFNLSTEHLEWYLNDCLRIQVTPTSGHKFICWGDSNTDNPRTFKISSDIVIHPIIQ